MHFLVTMFATLKEKFGFAGKSHGQAPGQANGRPKSEAAAGKNAAASESATDGGDDDVLTDGRLSGEEAFEAGAAIVRSDG